MTVTVT